MLRVLFIGMPEMGVTCLDAICEAKKNIVGLILPPKDNLPVYEVMYNLAKKWNLDTISFEKSLKEPEFLQKVKEKNADIAIVSSFNKKLPKELLSLTKMGFINSHPSKLPLYRGGNPYFYPIFNNDKTSAITLHFMDEDFDTGDIIYQQEFPLLANETMGTLFNRTNYLFAKAQVNLINYLEDGNKLPRIPQDKKQNYPKAPILYEHLGHTHINWKKLEACQIERFIRACNPFLGAYSYFKDTPIKIYSAKFDNNKVSKFPAGTICEIENKAFGISAKKGILYPTSMQVGSYFWGNAEMFLDLFKPLVGEVFQ